MARAQTIGVGLRARLVVAAAVLCAVVAGTIAVLLVSIQSLRQEEKRARHSEQVIAVANRLERLTLDLETGQRGYVLTHDPRFLEPWRAALVAAPRTAAELETLVADDPMQARRAATIRRSIASYIDVYSRPLIATAHLSIVRARNVVAAGEGKRRIDALRHRFDAFTRAESAVSDERTARAVHASQRSVEAVVLGSGLLLLFVCLIVAYVARLVAAPIRRVAGATRALARGDYAARVPRTGVGEVLELSDAFNEMAVSLAEAHDELESQNAELELQTSELEDHQAELARANDALRVQHDELERALTELDEERHLVRLFYEFGQRIAGETEMAALADVIVDGLSRAAGADAATMHAKTGDDDGEAFTLVAMRGLDPAGVPTEVRPGVGFGGRAAGDRTTVEHTTANAAGQIQSMAGTVTLVRELYLPLLHGDDVLGVVTLGWVSGSGGVVAREALEHLAGQAAVAWATACAFLREHRASTINRATLAATRDSITLAAPDGRIVLRNPAAEAALPVYGIRGATIQETTDALGDRIVDPAPYRAWIDTALGDPEYSGEYAFCLADSDRSFLSTTSPVRDDHGEILGRLFVVRETTTEREADRLKTELVSTVSHELRTPLASILGFTELLLAREIDPESQRQYLETVYSEGQRLTDLVNQFLDLQRMESGVFDLQLETVDIGAVVRDSVAVFEGQSDRHSIEVTLDDPETLAASADAERIRQVMANLLSNAIKYSPAGGSVEVGAARRNGAVRVAVQDAGVGIPSDQQVDVFKKFFRADSSDTQSIGGTGLGLALCREIIEAHGGRIGFESVEGRGSTFWFELPAGRSQ